MANKLGALERLYVKRMTNMLADRGKQIIQRAADSKESGNDTLNQMDAYGLVIYYNGKAHGTTVFFLAQDIRFTIRWTRIPIGTAMIWLQSICQ